MSASTDALPASILGDRAAFQVDLHEWWLQKGRTYPWRVTRDPYRILIAELMLHRTRAGQVLPVYARFLERYPDARSFVRANSGDIRELLRPLGLRWRTELILDLARVLREENASEVPADPSALASLPGVGDYITSAVSCFASGSPTVLLDTNIVRVLARLSGTLARDSWRRSSKMRSFLEPLVDKSNPREFYFGLLDLGALVCTPSDPDCPSCPVSAHCYYATGIGDHA